MKSKILAAFIACLCAAMAATAIADTPADAEASKEDYKTIPVRSSMSKAEGRIRDAAVKVSRVEGGHGSGSLIEYEGSQFILTAQHVADGAMGQTYLIGKHGHQKVAILIYSDSLKDIALLYLPPFEKIPGIKPMPWKPLEKLADVGVNINYSGYPSYHALLTFRGSIAGYEMHPRAGVQLILNVFGWFGSSGSVVYTEDGFIVGVLWAVDVDGNRNQVNEDIVWVSPIQNIDIDLALRPLCAQIPDLVEACK